MTNEDAIKLIREKWQEVCSALPYCHSPAVVLTLSFAEELDALVTNAYIYSWNIEHLDARFDPVDQYENGFQISYLIADCVIELQVSDPIYTYENVKLIWDGRSKEQPRRSNDKEPEIDPEWKRWLEIE